MSKAFTRESDEPQVEPTAGRPSFTLPAGVKNYLTADGAQRLQAELSRLLEERVELLAQSDSKDAKHQVQLLDLRVAQLRQSLQTAVVVPRPDGVEYHVKFGATVLVRNQQGEEERYRIVGVDEIDIDRGWISFLSPIARALMHAQSGQRVPIKLPSGQDNLEILKVEYE